MLGGREVKEQSTFIVMSVGSAVRLVLITALVIALLIVSMSGTGTAESDGPTGEPSVGQSHG
jgi:hypothetical protein